LVFLAPFFVSAAVLIDLKKTLVFPILGISTKRRSKQEIKKTEKNEILFYVGTNFLAG
jgi:hypothetical protein